MGKKIAKGGRVLGIYARWPVKSSSNPNVRELSIPMSILAHPNCTTCYGTFAAGRFEGQWAKSAKNATAIGGGGAAVGRG